MTNDECRRNDEAQIDEFERCDMSRRVSELGHSDLFRHSAFGFHHSFMVFLQAPHLNFSFLQ